MSKRQILTIVFCFFLWLLINIFLYPSLINAVFDQEFPFWFIRLYELLLFLILGLILGWLGREKGILSGFVLGLTITVLFIILGLSDEFFSPDIQDMGSTKAVFRIIKGGVFPTIYLCIGGFAGSWVFQKIKTLKCKG